MADKKPIDMKGVMVVDKKPHQIETKDEDDMKSTLIMMSLIAAVSV